MHGCLLMDFESPESLVGDVVAAKMELELPLEPDAASKSWNLAWIFRAPSSSSTSDCSAFFDDIAIVCAVVRAS